MSKFILVFHEQHPEAKPFVLIKANEDDLAKGISYYAQTYDNKKGNGEEFIANITHDKLGRMKQALLMMEKKGYTELCTDDDSYVWECYERAEKKYLWCAVFGFSKEHWKDINVLGDEHHDSN